MKPVLHNQDLCCPSEVVCHCHLVQTGLAEANTCEFGFPGAQVWAVPGSAHGQLRPCPVGWILVEAVSKPASAC